MLYFLALILVYHLNDDNSKSSFIVLGEEVTFGTNGSFGALEKSLVLISIKKTQNGP